LKNLNYVFMAAVIAFGAPAFAQTVTPTEIDCSNPANAEAEICLRLPNPGATNFAPLVAGAAGLLGLAALAGGGSTTSTTSTTTTTP